MSDEVPSAVRTPAQALQLDKSRALAADREWRRCDFFFRGLDGGERVFGERAQACG